MVLKRNPIIWHYLDFSVVSPESRTTRKNGSSDSDEDAVVQSRNVDLVEQTYMPVDQINIDIKFGI